MPEPAPPTRLAILARQFSNSMVVLLAGAAAVSLVIGETVDAVVITAILIANAALGYIEEGRADDAARAIRKLLAPRARVRRDGIALEIDAAGVVPGDVVVLQAGDRVPADGHVSSAARLELDESLLTGESLPVPKSPLAGGDDERARLSAGTTAVRGSATMVVTATGADTRIAQIASSGPVALRRTPLQERLDRLTGVLLRVAIAICVGLATVAWAYGDSVAHSLLVGVSLAVAAVPEGLPAVVTVVLAIGVRRMAERGAIVRRLPALETLGSTTVICTDKTGTLTENRMRLVRVYDCATGTEGAPSSAAGEGGVLQAAVLASEAEPAAPTERAILEAASALGIDRGALIAAGRVVRVEPFDAQRKRMSVVVEFTDGARRAYVKGAPEALLPSASAVAPGLAARIHSWAAAGMRVLVVGVRDLDGDHDDPERDIEPIGLLALADAPRSSARHSVEQARRAGVRTIMVTGDHPQTALYIARQTGIVEAGDNAVVTGAELDDLSESELDERCGSVNVFARVVPEHKLRIVEALKRDGEIVAMTGDGVNDVPALRAAHIGVAMGARGSDAAAGAADMVLADDDYSTIVAATRSGRAIYDNIGRFVQFLLAANTGEVLVFALALLLGMDAPLTVIQILAVNLLTDGLPAMALGLDPPDPRVMDRPPRPPAEPLLKPIRAKLAVGGIAMGIAAFASFAVGNATTHALGQTMAFTTLVAGQLIYVFAVRGDDWFFKAGHSAALLGAVAISAAVGVLVLAVEPLMDVFDTVPMSPQSIAIALALALVPFFATELLKARLRMLR